MKSLYQDSDVQRPFEEQNGEVYRSEYRRDYARLLHSAAFRRLQGKTQLFPGIESDFFRNRLSHSLEVAQVAKSIANKINASIKPFCSSNKLKIDTDLIEFAGLAHDLGHPPFGHIGEMALSKEMFAAKAGGFEGNAQTLRQVAVLEKKIQGKNGEKFGLNLCYRSLAAILKYDNQIPLCPEGTDKIFKGYYSSEDDLVSKIKQHVVGDPSYPNFKTIECCIMDKADDIAYATYDIEDSMKAGFVSLIDFFNLENDPDFEKIVEDVQKEISDDSLAEDMDAETVKANVLSQIDSLLNRFFAPTSGSSEGCSYDKAKFLFERAKQIQKDGFSRTEVTSWLVGQFINGVTVKFDEEQPSQSKVSIEPKRLVLLEFLKRYTYVKHIKSTRLKITEYRGKDFVKKIFRALYKGDGYFLLPDDWKELIQCDGIGNPEKARVVCDFIAGMTDRYALEFYGRLFSENPQTIFKDV